MSKPDMGSLDARRAALRRKLQSLAGVAERQLIALVKTRNEMSAIDVKMALLDREINGIVDTSLSRVAEYHRREMDRADAD